MKSRRQPYVLLACFFWTYALGTLYWTLHLLLLDATPQVFYVSELGWIASYIFLLTMEMTRRLQKNCAFGRNYRGWRLLSLCRSLFFILLTVMSFSMC